MTANSPRNENNIGTWNPKELQFLSRRSCWCSNMFKPPLNPGGILMLYPWLFYGLPLNGFQVWIPLSQKTSVLYMSIIWVGTEVVTTLDQSRSSGPECISNLKGCVPSCEGTRKSSDAIASCRSLTRGQCKGSYVVIDAGILERQSR